MNELVKEAFKAIEKRFEEKTAITGVPTGFSEFDKMTAGLQPSDLIIVAGRPSMGKTALALNMAQSAAVEQGKGVAVFSLEMAKEQLVMRMLCSQARIDASRMRGGFLKDSDWPKLAKAAGQLSQAPIYIDDTGAISILEMRAKCRRLQADKGLDLIMVDYLQLMRGSSSSDGSREREISEISRGLKALARELSVPVIALSQLNRSLEQRQDKRPMLSDLRESGAIEQDADVITFVYRDEYYNPESEDKGLAEIIIGKQRNGATGTVKLTFLKHFTLFADLQREAA
jgi:replicative DNA helicase